MKPLFLKNIKLIHRLNKNLILDPNFQIRSEELVLNGDFSQQGSQNWILGPGWSIGEYKALCIVNSNHTRLTQIESFLIGKTYKVTFDIVVVSGNFKIQLLGGGSDSGNNITSTQIQYTEYLVPTSNRTSFGIRSNDGAGIGSITNISITEIYASWNTLNNFSIDTNQIGFIVCNGRGTLIQNNILEIGFNYEITIDLVNPNNSAQFFIDQLNPIIQSTDTSILKFEFISTQTYLSLSSENFIGKISKITLIKN